MEPGWNRLILKVIGPQRIKDTFLFNNKYIMSTDNNLEPIRHSLSHLMSMAIMEKYPKAGLAVGPAIDNGFYQDYDLPEALSEKDFAS